MKRLLILVIVLFALLNLTACGGTLEIGVERTATPGQPAPAAVMSDTDRPATPTRPPTPSNTPTPTNTPTTIQAAVAASPSYQANDHCGSPAISSDGRYVLFSTGASNLVPGDTNGESDIFIYDTEAHITELVSRAEDGSPTNGASYEPGVSADGRWVVFTSMASNLVAGDANDLSDIFVHDRQTGRTTLVSIARDGTSGNGTSMDASISADGRWIAFTSSADDLVPEVDDHTGENTADTNEMADIFVYDRLGGPIRRVSLSSNGEQSNHNSDQPGISADGRWVVFWSVADNLVPGAGRGIYLHDRSTGSTQFIADGLAPTISPDGRWVGFLPISSDLAPDDASYAALYDRQTGEISVIGGYAKRGIEGRPSRVIDFSMDGTWLAISSVFNPPDSPFAGNDSEWGQQVFLRDERTGTFTLVSAAPDGLPGNSFSALPSLSADGRWIAFQSHADNLIAGDTNGYMDVFVYDRETGTIELVSWAAEP